MSLPDPPLRKSCPPPPWMVSLPDPPLRCSSALVPVMVLFPEALIKSFLSRSSSSCLRAVARAANSIPRRREIASPSRQAVWEMVPPHLGPDEPRLTLSAPENSSFLLCFTGVYVLPLIAGSRISQQFRSGKLAESVNANL